MDLHCPKCVCRRTGDVLGSPCQSTGCDGIIERQPEYRELVDILPEPMSCGRRQEIPDSHKVFKILDGTDHWDKFKTNGHRVCSFCGSLHPDDFFTMVKTSAEAPENAPYREVIEIEVSDKLYKIYVHDPAVRNAHEGGIKFYTHHLPRKGNGELDVPPERTAEFVEAQRRSNVRFMAMMNNAGWSSGQKESKGFKQ